jgi:GTPase SAR1 family protein
MQRNYDFVFKVVLLGPSATGKTALLKRYADDQFEENMLTTIGVDFKFKYTIDHVDRLTFRITLLSYNFGTLQGSNALKQWSNRTIGMRMLLF